MGISENILSRMFADAPTQPMMTPPMGGLSQFTYLPIFKTWTKCYNYRNRRGDNCYRRYTALKLMEADMDNSSNKPLAATLMQEFQNLKDKFKSEDDGIDRGITKIRTLEYHNRMHVLIRGVNSFIHCRISISAVGESHRLAGM